MNEIFIIVIVVFLIMIAISSRDIHKTIDVKCELHKWTYDTNNMMFCRVCKKTPEELNNE